MKHLPRSMLFKNTKPSSKRSASHAFLDDTCTSLLFEIAQQICSMKKVIYLVMALSMMMAVSCKNSNKTPKPVEGADEAVEAVEDAAKAAADEAQKAGGSVRDLALEALDEIKGTAEEEAAKALAAAADAVPFASVEVKPTFNGSDANSFAKWVSENIKYPESAKEKGIEGGVEIGDDGSIQVNGKTIDKITVEGKTFFQNDPQMASKNLPAKMVKKIKVIRKKSEQAEFTGIDDGQEQNVLDLSVQDNMMNGTFGNLTAGIGHDIPEQAILEDDYNWGKEGWLSPE